MTRGAPTLAYEVVDVFTDTAYAGNPLAVVLDADDLTAGQRQAMAAEFGLSETAFVCAPTVAGADYRLLIHTPLVELPFAGHPSVGASWVLGRLGRVAGDAVQECGAGLLPVVVGADACRITGGPPTVGSELDPAPLLLAVGLTAADLEPGAPAVRACGTGISFAVLPVRRDAVDRAVPDGPALAALGELAPAGVAVAAWSGSGAYTRVFAGGVGVLEDAATGSAACGYAVWLAAGGLVPDGNTAFEVVQGVAMRRPSRLHVEVEVSDGAAVRASVGGGVAPVARGEIRVPARG